MQNKTAIWLFTILLAIACLYQLSFGWVVSSVEADAKADADIRHLDVKDSLMNLIPAQYSYKVGKKSIVFADSNTKLVDSIGLAELRDYFEQKYLIGIADKPVYPLFGSFGHTYQYCKNHQLNLGLDLQGGMSVTLEVSMTDLVKNLAGAQAMRPEFKIPFELAEKEYSTSTENFIDLFKKHWDEVDENQRMVRIFSVGSKDKFSDKLTNEEVIQVLKEQAIISLDKTEEVIMARINKFGVSQPSVYKDIINGRIHLELPGVKDVERARRLIQTAANLEFWEVPTIDAAFAESLGKVKKHLFNKERLELNQKVMDLDSVEVIYETTDSVWKLDANNLVMVDSSNNPILDSITPADSLRAYTKPEMDSLIAVEMQGGNPWDLLITEPSYTYGVMGRVKVTDTARVNSWIYSENILNLMPRGVEFAWAYKADLNDDGVKEIALYALDKDSGDGKARITGDHLDEASYGLDPNGGGLEIRMLMTTPGANAWCDWTRERIKKSLEAGSQVGLPIAIVMDGVVYSAP